MAVVVSSAMLVTATNIAAKDNNSDFLSGKWKESQQNKNVDTLSLQITKNKEKGLKPISVASRAVNPIIKANDKKNTNEVGGKIVVAPISPVMKDPQEGAGVQIYTVASGDNISSIAQKYRITTNTILWANDIENSDSIMPGDKIFILPIAGLTHVVKKGDTLDKIAKEYEASKEKIISFNDLPANGEITEGQKITIPDGVKDIPEPEPTTIVARRSYSTTSGGSAKVSGLKKLEGKAGKGHRFPYGYCTWYVAQKRYVPWGGNAGTWLYNARAYGYKTGKKPRAGSIVVTSESWWGHVAVVEKVGKGTITISEMNAVGWGKISRRTISTKNRVIRGYIY